jgi:hypothetical protein
MPARTWYHGTGADLAPGDLLEPGHPPVWEPVTARAIRRVHYTSDLHWAMLYAAEAADLRLAPDGDILCSAQPRVYTVRPLARRGGDATGEQAGGAGNGGTS